MTIGEPRPHKEPQRSEFSINAAFAHTNRILGENFVGFSVVYGAFSIPGILIGEFGGLTNLLGWLVFVVVAGAALAIAEVLVTRSAYAALWRESREGVGAELPSDGIWERAIGAYILITVVVIIALFMLIIPGIILSILLFFVIPAIVIDDQNILGSIERSIRVAEGNRGPVYVAVFFYVAIYIAVPFIFEAIVGSSEMSIILDIAWNGVAGAYGVVLALVIYEQLKAAQKSAEPDL